MCVCDAGEGTATAAADRAGTTLYKAISFPSQASLAPAAVMKQIDGDGTASAGSG